MRAGNWVPEHDLVVITGGDDVTVDVLGKTPDLTIGVRAHDVLLVSVLAAGDGTVALTDEESVHVEVNGTHEAAKINAHGHGSGAGIDAVDLAVLAA